ncbi:uncharacterized protein LOC134206610 [Armigeres subalbatus]|uniref:uncharacterized protein LOC134206610 n=1 Tax=Armigeres subalbatus TaxID=124917 RepID=UPI002ED625F3
MVFVGYCNQQKAYRFLDKDTGRITISRDVRFMENLEFGSEKAQGRSSASEGLPPAGKSTEVPANVPDADDSIVELDPLPKRNEKPNSDEAEDFYDTSEVFSSGEENGAESEGEVQPSGGQPAEQPDRRRATRGQLPVRFSDYEMGMVALETDEPTTYKEAITCGEKKKLVAGMTEEYCLLMSNQTWEVLVPGETERNRE